MAKEPAHPNRPWILVADDSRVVRRAIVHILGKELNVLEACDGQDAWRVLRQDSRVELLISDIQMPELNGYNLICKLRASDDPGLRELPIMVITSAEDEVTRERAYACGANDFILKPFKAKDLWTRVLGQLDEARENLRHVLEQPPATPAAQPAHTAQVLDVVPNTNRGNLASAVKHLDAGINILRGLQTNVVAPHALTLTLRLLPLLKFCNARYSLGMDHEITVFQERLMAVRARMQQSKSSTAA